jgi:D-threo-aldose 1-dehydrogenase
VLPAFAWSAIKSPAARRDDATIKYVWFATWTNGVARLDLVSMGETATERGGVARLGFGCARLLMQLDPKAATALLHSALDAGVSHLDVARSYGDGRTESIVGEVARTRRAQMTIVTKTGLFAPGVFNRALRKVYSLTGRTRDAPARSSFDSRAVALSIEQSLRALRTDYLDALLLHGCAVDDISDDLKRVLLAAKQKGMTKRLGIATMAAHASAIARTHPEISDVVQIEAAELHTLEAPRAGEVITHSVLAGRGEAANIIWAQKLSDALLANPRGVVLFSSSLADHIRENAAIADELASKASSISATALSGWAAA